MEARTIQVAPIRKSLVVKATAIGLCPRRIT